MAALQAQPVSEAFLLPRDDRPRADPFAGWVE